MTDEHSTFDQEWRNAVAGHSDRTFLLFRDAGRADSEWTYGEFDQLVEQARARLRELGIRPGDAVHMCLSNCPAFIVLWLAIARMGAWMVPVDPSSSTNDLAAQTQRTSARVTFIDEAAADRATSLPANHTTITLTQTAEDLRPDGPLWPVNPDRREQTGAHLSAEAFRPGPLDRLAVMFTSGTTSQPKGVVLTQANYGYTATTMARLAQLGKEHRWLVSLPLFHGNAQFYCVASAIAAGASIALTASFSASGWTRDAAELEATHASLFAAPVRMILARNSEDAPQLTLAHVWFAQNLSPSQYQEFARVCGVHPRQLYGMTETTAVVTCQPIGSESHDVIGTVVPGRAVRIDDAAGNQADSGLLRVNGRRGIDLFLEYLDAPDITARVFAPDDSAATASLTDGCGSDDQRSVTRSLFTTGDIVERDATGTLRFSGRADDIIKVAGENVSLADVEAVLSAAPGVLEVAVIALPDPVRDVIPQAHVVSRDPRAPVTLADLEEYATLHLPKAARPRSWIFAKELPRTSVGKIRKFTLVPPTSPSARSAG